MIFELPVQSGRVTQWFGANPDRYRPFGFPGHEGIDWGVPINTPVFACADGIVVKVTSPKNHPYGTHIRIQHQIDGQIYTTVYAHLNKVLVKPGQRVFARQIIALSGNTGNSTGPHLHLTVVKAGATASGETSYPRDVVDPKPLLKWR